MKILVTGGGGFLGSQIVAQLLRRQHQVVIYQRSRPDKAELSGCAHISGCLTDANALRRAAEGCAAVIHTAAKAGVWGSWQSYFEPNVTGTENVIAACHAAGVRWLVYTSTPSVVHRRHDIEGADESLDYPKTYPAFYAATKALAERAILMNDNPKGLRTCSIRPHLIWGAGDPHLVPRLLDKARRGRLPILGDGKARVDLTHVFNAAQAHVLAIEALVAGRAGGKAYFVSDGAPVVTWDWIGSLIESVGLPPLKHRLGKATAIALSKCCEAFWAGFGIPGEPPLTEFSVLELSRSHWYRITAAEKDLHYRPSLDLEKALTEMVTWAKALL